MVLSCRNATALSGGPDLFGSFLSLCGFMIRFSSPEELFHLSQVVLHSVTDLVLCHSVVFRWSTVDLDSARTIHAILAAAFKLICAMARKHDRIMVAEQCVVGEPVVVRTCVAARWYAWALVVTSSGVVDPGILATYFETGCHDRGRGL